LQSTRPQFSVLWRIPGTTIYRNIEQESGGVFIANVFIVRIGASLYFGNAAYVKDMLLSYVKDLSELNPTEYMVLEMTSVAHLDSTAVNILADLVKEFRRRGIELAFAMVSNRVDHTLRKNGLKAKIGEKWFFHTVHDAVDYCVAHQHAKKGVNAEEAHGIAVHSGDEVGCSNDVHSDYTVVFLFLEVDVPMITSDIVGIFRQESVNIVRANIESQHHDKGARHTYYLTDVKTGEKLTQTSIAQLRQALISVLRQHKPTKIEESGDLSSI